MNELGKLNQLHFIDLNKKVMPYQLAYTTDIKKLEDAERKIEFIEQTCKDYNIELNPCQNIE